MEPNEFNNSSALCQVDIGILMIATNEYLERWKSTAQDLDKYAYKRNKNVNIHLFTNRKGDALDWSTNNLHRIKLIPHEIAGWGWPEATLYRYKFISNHESEIIEEFLMYLDSDMSINRDFSTELFQEVSDEHLAFVQHPGFHRSRKIKFLLDIFANPRLINSHVSRLMKRSSEIGSWEEDVRSKAFVPKNKRRQYVHGAVWFGRNADIKQMCKTLAGRVEDDEKASILAIWHDESHLNWYASNSKSKILSSKFSGSKKFRNNRALDPYILSVEKEIGEGRKPTQHPDISQHE